MNKKRIIIIIIFILLSILSLLIGANMQLIRSMFSGDREALTVFLHGRLPRLIAIILSGSALAIAGLILQSLARNKFVSPQIIGSTDSASLGLLLSFIIFGTMHVAFRFMFGFVFALGFSLLFMLMLRKIKFKNLAFVPLIGLMYGAIIGALTLLIADLLDLRQMLAGINLGSFTQITLSNAWLLLILVPAIVLAFVYALSFSIMSAGEDFAKNLGVNYKLVYIIGLTIVAIVAASVFIVVGPLPFVGLIIPNIVVLYYGEHVKKNILDIAIFGAIFVLFNDILSRVLINPGEIAVGLTMSITGGIIFLFLILRRPKHE